MHGHRGFSDRDEEDVVELTERQGLVCEGERAGGDADGTGYGVADVAGLERAMEDGAREGREVGHGVKGSRLSSASRRLSGAARRGEMTNEFRVASCELWVSG